MRDIKKITRSLVYAFKGLRHAYVKDRSFRLEINYGFPLFLIGAWLLAPMAPWEVLFYTLAYFLVLLVELINTAFETMLDKLHPEQHDMIGRSKDIAAGAVLTAFFILFVVLVVLAYPRLFPETATITHLFA